MTFWQLPPEALRADPPLVETTALAVLPLTLDTRPYLAEGETPSAPLTTLTDLRTGKDMDLPSARLSAEGVITQVVGGLVRGHTYRLVWSWQVGPRHRPSRITVIRCVG